jgi:RNA 3'-terminal phosphate cyclase (ATP)
VLAAAEVCGADVEGAALGSAALTFSPGKVRAGEYRFTVGTAGSGTLVFQTVLPALMLAGGPSRLVIEGGTHNHAAPPFDFLARVFVPLIERMGPKVRLTFDRYGFYPAGGGRFSAEIEPCAKLAPLDLGERGEMVSRRVLAVVANLPGHIAMREIETASAMLGWNKDAGKIDQTTKSAGPGNIVMIEAGFAGVTEIFSAFGQPGVSAEAVASAAAREAREYLASRAAAGEHLTDQLLLPLALAGGGSFTAQKLNMHARTNMDVISRFLPARFETQEEDGLTRVSVAGNISVRDCVTSK